MNNDDSSYKKCFLSKGKESGIKRGHPWVFSGAIRNFETVPTEGEWLEVRDSSGEYLATGYFSAEASIAVRICCKSAGKNPNQIIAYNLKEAIALRQSLGLPNETTNLFRLVHGEGDQLSGLIIDIYGKTAVVQCHTAGMYALRTEITDYLMTQSELDIKAVYDKSSETMKSGSIKPGPNGYLAGGLIDESFKENRHAFLIDWINGQKTGFFIDQRENRALLGHYSKGKKVLNTFCYTGGFSVYALAAGASEVHSLDSSEKALEVTKQNVSLNPTSGKHEVIKADAVEYIRQIADDYDVIVLDPPAFAKNQRARHNALQAYKRLNRTAIERIKPGGIIFTFSCSQAVDKEMFRGAVLAAAIESGRKVSILHQLHQPADHPVSIFHPEGEYLKGLVLRVS